MGISSVLTIILGAVIAILLTLYLYFTWNFNYWKKRGVAGPRPKPFLGTYPKTATLQKDSNFLLEADEIYKKYWRKHRFVGTFEYADPVLLVLDPVLAKEVFVKSFKHFNHNALTASLDPMKDPLLASNPFHYRNEQWKECRAEISPALSLLKVKAMYPIVEKIGEQMVKYIDDKIESGMNHFVSQELTEQFTAEVISNCGYGLENNSFGEFSEFLTEARNSFAQTSWNAYHHMLVKIFPFLHKLIPARVTPQASTDWFIHLMERAIKTRKQSGGSRDDFLNSLLELQAKKGSSLLTLAAHGFTLFLDGYGASSYFLAYTLDSLAKHPEIQRKLRDEIASYETIGFDELSQMPYLDMVFCEGIRPLNPFPFPLWKMCSENIDLTDYDGRTVTIEKGTRVLVPIHSIHHHPEFYVDPDVFIPERFDESDGKGLKYYKDAGLYMPFGNGPRLCLGMRFGTMQIKVALCALIKNFEIREVMHRDYSSSQTASETRIEFRRL